MNLGLRESHTTSELVELGVTLVRKVMQDVLRRTESDPEYYLAKEQKGGKSLLTIDGIAEATVRDVLQRNARSRKIRVLGEESLKPNAETNLTNEKGTVLLVDAVDGTDLLERGFGNWCAAAVFYTPSNSPGTRIRCAFVATAPPHSHIYWASDESDGAFKVPMNGKTNHAPSRVAGPSGVQSLTTASICFYGQKVDNLLKSSDIFKQCGSLVEDGKKKVSPYGAMRIYNLAGIPMMVRLCDKTVAETSHVDAVFDIVGQQPHDVIPGAFIARKGGAVLKHLDGTDISLQEMEDLLLRPSKGRLKYVLAATTELAMELIEVVGGRLPTPMPPR